MLYYTTTRGIIVAHLQRIWDVNCCYFVSCCAAYLTQVQLHIVKANESVVGAVERAASAGRLSMHTSIGHYNKKATKQ